MRDEITVRFVCVICNRPKDNRWHGPKDRMRAIPPMCNYCEGSISKGTRYAKRGAFMDRRNAMRILVLAEVLSSEAHWKQHGARYGSA